MMYVPCGEKEIAYLKSKDKKLAAVIESLGVLERPVHDDVFSAVVHHIIGQQISTKAQEAVWTRLCEKVASRDFNIAALYAMSDDEVICTLSSLKGVGDWTAEMLLIFTLRRPDVLSFGDLGIQRGLRMLYRHREIDRKKFNRYKKRYSPYASTASLYLWAVAGGAIEGLTDPAAKARQGGAVRQKPNKQQNVDTAKEPQQP